MHPKATAIVFSSIFFVPLVLLESSFFTCFGIDTISFNDTLADNGERRIISAGNSFEMGYFSESGGRFLGIWYYESPEIVVWIANRDQPLKFGYGLLGIASDGKLKLWGLQGTLHFSTSLLEISSGINRTMKLLDSGNLVLVDKNSGTNLWQSFESPTNTFLPGMRMTNKLTLTSWSSPYDPGSGHYRFRQDKEDRKKFLILNDTILYWKLNTDYDNKTSYDDFLFLLLNSTNLDYKSSIFSRIVMNSAGDIRFYDNYNDLIWKKPGDDLCSINNPCGNFRFEPDFSDNNGNFGRFSSGCARKSACNKNTRVDTFLDLKLTEVGTNYSTFYKAKDENTCRAICLGDCECRAFSFAQGKCLIWTTDLNSIKIFDPNYGYGYYNLSIRVTASNIKSTSRDCESCGRYILPYPLSSGHNCGDPSYHEFFCNKSLGTFQFRTLNGSYKVISIDKNKSRFVIRPDDDRFATNCGAKNSARRVVLLDQAVPFNVTNWCNQSSEGESIIEISWKPPLEPPCNSSSDCLDWPNSICSTSQRRCLCNSNYRWDGLTLNCTKATELKKSERFKHEKKVIVSITVIASVLVSVNLSFIFFRSRILVKRNVAKLHNGDMMVEDKKVIDVPFFSLESIIAATNNFSDENKLGRGGFGPVYKGAFLGENEMAVKRLSIHSRQGIEEFQNEVVLIAKLQHRNLVRLLGYCIKGSEKLLLYEYMPNKSLDTFIFDQGLCILLDWKKRFDIILGIARGLLYLHQDSRLRVVHRDMKTSNVLLDEDLNPKISDFGLARIVRGKETQVSVGTYGYISPEYALEGIFSMKSDVFSFGVIVLEIISGKRNSGFYEEVPGLLGYAWKLWQERRVTEFVDTTLLKSLNSSSGEFLKCINIGLLCVQQDPVHHPTMVNVLAMLSSETSILPNPNQPAFVPRKCPSTSPPSNLCSINEVTLTEVEGR